MSIRTSLHTKEPIKVEHGIGWDKNKTTSVYAPNDMGETEIIVETEDCSKPTRKSIKFRNVGEGNPGAMIQFQVSERTWYGEDKTRSRENTIYFSIPAFMAEEFIKAVSTPWK